MDLKLRRIFCGGTAAALMFGAVTGCSTAATEQQTTADTSVTADAADTMEETTVHETSATATTTVADTDTDDAGTGFKNQGEINGIGYMLDESGLPLPEDEERGYKIWMSTTTDYPVSSAILCKPFANAMFYGF